MAQIKQAAASDSIDSMLERVKVARAKLQKDLDETSGAINRLESENAALPKMQASFEDIKLGILDLVTAAGERYLQGTIRPQLAAFATGGLAGLTMRDNRGKPLTLGELDGAINGTLWPEARAQLITPMKGEFDDLAMYAVFGDAIKAALTKAMETLNPNDFGFSNVRPEQIGPTRAEMNARIAENNREISRLKEHRATLQEEITKFGFK